MLDALAFRSGAEPVTLHTLAAGLRPDVPGALLHARLALQAAEVCRRSSEVRYKTPRRTRAAVDAVAAVQAYGPTGLAMDDIGGHATQVGAPQDMLAYISGIATIQQAGGWKSLRMPARYGERLEAKRSGAAILAEIQGR